MYGREQVLRRLDELGIAYIEERHPAVFTIADMDALGISKRGEVPKNLFLRDAGGKRHFLVSIRKDKTADLNRIRAILGTSALGFASEERLARCLKLTKGAVSPLGALNDADKAVEIIFDRDLISALRLGVHPNDNTATVWLSFDELKKAIEKNGHVVRTIDL